MSSKGRNPKVHDAQYAISSIEELVKQVSDIIVTNAREWANDDDDAAAHATATLGVVIRILIRETLPRVDKALTVPEATIKVFLDSMMTGLSDAMKSGNSKG